MLRCCSPPLALPEGCSSHVRQPDWAKSDRAQSRGASNARPPKRTDAIDMTNADLARDAPLPLYQLIYAVLRAHLVDGSFPRGLVLSESAVARAFGSSRTPAVNALQRLRDEGLIQDFDGFGYLAGRPAALPIRKELADIGLRLPPAAAANLKIRNHH